MEGRCYCCGHVGHKSPQCKDKEKPKSEWHITKVKEAEKQNHLNVQNHPTYTSSVAGSTVSNQTQLPAAEKFEWSIAQMQLQFFQTNKMKDSVLINSQSTTSLYCNRDLVTDIKAGKEWLNSATNGGVLKTNLTANIPGFHKRVWFHDKALTNILALHEVAEKNRITYDSEKESACCVHYNDKIVKYKQAPNGFHSYIPTKSQFGTQGIRLFNIVDENKMFYTL